MTPPPDQGAAVLEMPAWTDAAPDDPADDGRRAELDLGASGLVAVDGAPAEGFLDDESAGECPAEDARHGKVITVFSPKGGTGTTSVAVNLAILLGEIGNRVCLLDLSLDFGDVAFSLQLPPARTLVDAVALDLTADDAVDALTTEYRDNVDCVLAPVNPGEADRVTPAVVNAVLSKLRARYDFVVVDTPTRFSELVLEAMDVARHHVLVTTPEVTALKNMKLALDTLDMIGHPRDLRSLVVNRVASRGWIAAADIAKALGEPPAVQLPVTPNMTKALDAGAPLALTNPDNPAVSALRTFAKAVAAEQVGTRSRGHRARRMLARRRNR